MLKDLLAYLSPIDIQDIPLTGNSIGNKTLFYSKENEFPPINKANIAVIGIPEGRCAVNNEGCANAPDVIRRYFYPLYNHIDNLKMVDVGNIKQGKEPSDTMAAATAVISRLLAEKLFVIILGGGNNIVHSNYLAYENQKQLINLTCIDSRFDIGETENDADTSTSYLSKIILHRPNYLFNYTNIGFQSYYVDKKAMELIDSLYFDSFRLGVAREDIAEVEPAIRNSNIVSLDMSSVKAADAPGNPFSSPNGFTGDEICVLCRYAGCSDKVSSFGIYEYNPALDIEFRTAKLIGQILWYLIDGYYVRTDEMPYKDINKFIKYHVNSAIFQHEVVFYKSKQTNRWWMEVECPDYLKTKYAPHYLVSCSYKDYLSASNNEVPERWLQVYKKLM